MHEWLNKAAGHNHAYGPTGLGKLTYFHSHILIYL